MITLFIFGVYFIYEGGRLMNMKKTNPDKIPDRIYVVAVFTIVLGVISLIFAFAHFYIGTGAKKPDAIGVATTTTTKA